MAGAPQFDGPAFSRWLRRWKESEGFSWSTLAERSGCSVAAINTLARGVPQRAARDRGQLTTNPSINLLAQVAFGLGLELNYVLSKAGVTRRGARWANFSQDERFELAVVLGMCNGQGLAVLRDELLNYNAQQQEADNGDGNS